MRMFLCFSIFVLFFPCFSLPQNLAPSANQLQKKCADAFPQEMKSRVFAQSFLCGQKFLDADAKEIFRKTGLLHLMVVSGSHLQFLSFFLLLPIPFLWRRKNFVLIPFWILLFLYCLCAGFQPPLVRAFAAQLVAFFSQKFHCFWDFGKVQLYSGLLVLALIPEWISSFSFYLSWLATLGFLLWPLYQSSKSYLLKTFLNCFLIQALISFVFADFSLLSVAANSFLAPLIGLLLFPLSALPLLLPVTSPLADQGWFFLIETLTWISEYSDSSPEFPSLTSIRWLTFWTFLAVVHCFFEFLRQKRYQGSHV